MATRVRLTADVDPEVKKRVKLAAVETDTSVSEWVERAVVRELERVRDLAPSELESDEREVYSPAPGTSLRIPEHPVTLRGGKSMAETVLEDRGEW